ncbi:hypothetical protein DFH08DRAFT_962176 [Mycena albidolilacea]|uniref:Uncharacterized protein n=1 Tax=Mycena albidolilacea TaxID=1033008 RepID=A0AAD6ZYC9_9AGAR|nr:hypothetical protein DFH08DRAFT_962176 [Mycena albidolilacea]
MPRFLSSRGEPPPSRARLKPPKPLPSRARFKPPNALPDAFWTSMVALQQSADAFPPLKTTVDRAIALCHTAERMEHLKADAYDVAFRVKDIMDILADTVPDAFDIPPTKLQSINRFSSLLDRINRFMESISSASPRSAYTHFKTRLDDTCRDLQNDRPFCDINASRGSLSTHSQSSLCPAVRSLGPQDPWLPPAKSAPLNALPDVLWTSILALKESADAVPPLKSAVSAAIALCQVAERTEHSKSDASAIALRVKEIMDVIADAVPDGSDISPRMLQSIDRFTALLEKIQDGMQKIVFASRLSRFLHLNRNESLLKGFKTQLDDAYRDFLAASTLRLEVQQAQIAINLAQFKIREEKRHVELINLTTPNPWSSIYYSIGFFGRPLMLPYKWHTSPFLHDTHKPELAGLRARGHNRPTLLFRLCMEHIPQPVKHPTPFSRLKLMSL